MKQCPKFTFGIGDRFAHGAHAQLQAFIAAKELRIDINDTELPSAEEVNGWTSEQYVAALTHDQSNPGYNQHLRQLLHVGFKIAAHQGDT